MAFLAYVDTSALVKLAVDEPETEALHAWIARHRPLLVSSDLLRVEGKRATRDAPPQIQADMLALLEAVTTTPVTIGVCDRAAALPPAVMRTLDAVHVASAMDFGSELDVMVTYDGRMAEAARGVGIAVESPGVAA